jgi:hypothetical protein
MVLIMTWPDSLSEMHCPARGQVLPVLTKQGRQAHQNGYECASVTTTGNISGFKDSCYLTQIKTGLLVVKILFMPQFEFIE